MTLKSDKMNIFRKLDELLKFHVDCGFEVTKIIMHTKAFLKFKYSDKILIDPLQPKDFDKAYYYGVEVVHRKNNSDHITIL